MAWLSIDLTVKDDKTGKSVADSLKALQAAMTDMTKPLQEIGELYKASTLERFRSHTNPKGQAWKQLKPNTIALKKTGIITRNRKTGKVTRWREPAIESAYHQLIWTGKLRQSVRIRNPTKTSISIGAGDRLDYAHSMQLGSRRNNVPARPFLGANKKTNTAALKVISAYIKQVATGTP